MKLLRNSYFWLALVLATALFFFCYPIYVIWPFRHQDQQELQIALGVKRWASLATSACTIIGVIAAIRVWLLHRNWLPRTLVVVLALLTVAVSVLTRVNIYEQMFHPLEHPTFADISKTKLGDVEQVIAIRVAGTARAYPIRVLSYHHIVNDVVGGLPVVATY